MEASERKPVELSRQLEALANPIRLDLLHHLTTPSFMADLVRNFDITRQALKKHLDALEAVGLVTTRAARRGPLPATCYLAHPSGVFTFKESIRGLCVRVDPALLPTSPTQPDDAMHRNELPVRPSLLLVHGESPGRSFALDAADSWILGRAPQSDICLEYDAFASARHALLRREGPRWSLTDLHSTNGTRVNFQPIAAGRTIHLEPGDLLTVGRSHLLLRIPR